MKRLPLVMLALCLAFGPAHDPARAGDVPRAIDEDGPTQGVQPLALRELWRIGGENEDVIFGRITDLEMHPDGSLYVLDNQLCHVVVISPDGEFVRNISREGDGPGEVRQPTGLIFLSDEILGIGTGFPAKLITLGLDGTPIDTYYPVGAPADGNVAVMISLQCVDGVLGASGGRIAFVAGGDSYTDRFLSIGDASLGEFHHILETTTPFDPTGFSFVEVDNYYIDDSWALGAGGRIYAPMKRDAYEISEFDTTGKLVRVFGRRYEPRRRTVAEKGRVSPLINPGTPANTDWTIDDHDPCVLRIMIDPDDGAIWVLTPHGHEDQPEGILETWDVFAPDGEYVRQVPIPLGHEMNEGTCTLVGSGKMVVVRGTGSAFGARADVEIEETEVEPLEVICYELTAGATTSMAK
jgi:hypothetical protein